MKSLIPAQKALRKHATASNKKINEWFFKTGPGQYGHGDQFIGVKVPEVRKVAKQFHDLPFADLKKLLHSPIHEDRLLALLILRHLYESAIKVEDMKTQKKNFDFLMINRKRVNNWDLVDQSAPYITGHFAFTNPAAGKKIFALIRSKSMWDRRIAMISTFYFIRQNRFNETIAMAEALLNDKEDLMHKASGWMLREMGKRDLKPLIAFLDRHGNQMPRTMLRYAIEKLPENQRKKYLKTTRK
jgi:3-methyladenine DNA glycosylase AlkD